MTQSRRQFVRSVGATGLALLAGCARPFSSLPPPAQVRRIGILFGNLPSLSNDVYRAAFRQGLLDLGYVEGQNVLIEERYANADDQLAEPVAELVRLQPEVILVQSNTHVRAVLAVSSTVPLVTTGGGTSELVAGGLAASYARPGGIVTGLSTPFLGDKLVQLFREAVSTLSRVVILFDATLERVSPLRREPYQVATRSMGLQLLFVGTSGPEDVESVLETAIHDHADGLVVLAAPIINQTQVAELALQNQVPSMCQVIETVSHGGLMGYGVNRADLWRRAASYVDKILKGARPGDLPIEQPTRFDFIVNLKTAQALGLTIPQTVWQQATEIIQ